ncbi:MAG TPA: glycosyltransferase family 39 protein [Polyangiaceae bacterium]|nr:glycosyltransferase family 39 protein [Polyangiaceae bacterium]
MERSRLQPRHVRVPGDANAVHPESPGLLGARGRALLLVVLFIVARIGLFRNLSSPVLGWRPADLAGIAVNYYRDGFHFLYPEVLWGGSGPGYVEMEFPAIPFATALLFEVFGVHEWVCTLVMLGMGVGIVYVTYRFAARLFDRRAALLAAAFAATAPTLVMLTTTGMWPDPPMVFFGELGLYLLVRWADERRSPLLVAAVASVALATCLKLTALYLGFPVLAIFVYAEGRSWWRRSRVWACAAGMLLPALLWYAHGYRLFLESHLTFGILGGGYSKLGSTALLANPRFYVKTAAKVFLYDVTPLATLGLLYGMWVRGARGPMRRGERAPDPSWAFCAIWFGSVVLYALVAATGVSLGHYHYLLPILPIGCIAGAAGLVVVADRSSARWGLSAAKSLGAVLAALLANAVVSGVLFVRVDRAFDDSLWQAQKQTGRRVGELTKPGSLLVVVDHQMDDVTPERSMTPPDVFYFADRHGFYRSMAWLTLPEVERLHALGARYVVVSGISADRFKALHGELFEQLSRDAKKIMDDRDGVVFDLDVERGAGS